MIEIMTFKPTVLTTYLQIDATVKAGIGIQPLFNDINQLFEQILQTAREAYQVNLEIGEAAHPCRGAGGKTKVHLICNYAEHQVTSATEVHTLYEKVLSAKEILQPLMSSLTGDFDVEFVPTILVPPRMQMITIISGGLAFMVGGVETENPLDNLHIRQAVSSAGFKAHNAR